MQKTLDFLNISILIILLALAPWFYGSVGFPAQYSIFLACIFMLVIWLAKPDIELTCHKQLFPLLCFLVLSAASILFSVYKYASILKALNLISYIIVFFITAEAVNNERKTNFIIWMLILIGLFYCGWGIFQYYNYLPRVFWAQDNSLSSRFVNSGSFAAFININIFLCLGLAFYHKNIFIKAILFLFSSIFFVSLILSNSRISWLTFVVSLFIFVVLELRNITSIKSKSFIFISIFGIIITLAIYFFRADILWRIKIAAGTQFQSLYQRLDIWKSTLRIILRHPFGTGIGTFQYIYPVYRIHSDRFFVETAHSDFLQITSESGIVGLALFGWFLARLFSVRRTIIASGLACAVFSFILQAVFDFPFAIPANAIIFFTCAALLGVCSAKQRTKVALFKYSKTAIFILIIFSTLFYTGAYLADKYYRLAEDNFTKMRWKEAVENYNKAITFMPFNADVYAGRGSLYSLRSQLAFGQQKKELRKEAISDFQKAINLNPHQSGNYLNLALLYIDEANPGEAIYAFNKAIENNPTNGEYYYPYADYCLEQGFLTKALEYYQKGLNCFINEVTFIKRYGDINNFFEKIYKYTKNYQQIKFILPEKLDAYLAFARYLEVKQETADAVSVYNEILSKFPGNKIAEKALTRLK